MSSAADLALYDIALDSHTFLEPATQESAWTPTVSNDGRTLPYGLGWFIQNYRGTRLVWHYGFWSSVSALYLKVPEYNINLMVLSNSDRLSKGYGLHNGNILNSPVARSFLKGFIRR